MKVRFILTGAVVLTAMFVIGQMLQPKDAVADSMQPYAGPHAGTADVEMMQSENPEDLLQMARGKIDKDSLREAALVTTAVLINDPTNEAFELYVEIYQEKARRREADKDHAASTRACAEALSAIEHWKDQTVSQTVIDKDTVSLIFELEDQTKNLYQQIAEPVVKEAEEMREDARRWPERWNLRDDRGQVIEALLILDALSPEMLSRELRERHSSIWTECYSMLGDRHKEMYKVRSNLQNN